MNFTIAEVAKKLRMSKQALFNWVKSGHLKARSLAGDGRRTLVVSENDLAAFEKFKATYVPALGRQKLNSAPAQPGQPVNTRQAAEFLGVVRQQVTRLARQGKLVKVPQGPKDAKNTVLVTYSSLIAYQGSRKIGRPPRT